MYTVPLEDVLKMTRVRPHEQLKAEGRDATEGVPKRAPLAPKTITFTNPRSLMARGSLSL